MHGLACQHQSLGFGSTNKIESQKRSWVRETLGNEMLGRRAEGQHCIFKWPRGRRQGNQCGNYCSVVTYEIIIIQHNTKNLQCLGINQSYF